MATLRFYIEERWQIFCKREARKEFPWTDDRVLQSFAFTNVFPQDDAVSKDVHSVLALCGSDVDRVFTVVCCRMVNKGETVHAIGPLSASRAGSSAEQFRIVGCIRTHGHGNAYVLPSFGAKSKVS